MGGAYSDAEIVRQNEGPSARTRHLDERLAASESQRADEANASGGGKAQQPPRVDEIAGKVLADIPAGVLLGMIVDVNGSRTDAHRRFVLDRKTPVKKLEDDGRENVGLVGEEPREWL
jgi:hypothetical protein